MTTSASARTYFDSSTQSHEETATFFLRHLLKARIELHEETGAHANDEEMNVYLAGLLLSFISTDDAVKGKPYLSPFDFDVRTYLDAHHDARTEYTVYKDNADFGLLSNAFFLGYHHEGSYFHKVGGERDESGRIALYYHHAASALAHLRGNRAALVHTFDAMAEHIGCVVRIVRKTAGEYFDFIEHMSDGSAFHLEREVDQRARDERYRGRMDAFLKAYSAYCANPCELTLAGVKAIAEELKDLNPAFSFDAEKPGKSGLPELSS